MPVVMLNTVLCSRAQKDELLRRYSEITSEVLGVPIERIYVFINEHPLDSVASGGTPFSERAPASVTAALAARARGE